jgi:hypothetical protein
MQLIMIDARAKGLPILAEELLPLLLPFLFAN